MVKKHCCIDNTDSVKAQMIYTLNKDIITHFALLKNYLS